MAGMSNHSFFILPVAVVFILKTLNNFLKLLFKYTVSYSLPKIAEHLKINKT